MKEGRIGACFLAGVNPLADLPASTGAREALKAVDFLVVQDLFMTEAAELADVILPARSYAEKDGTFTNMEGRVQAIQATVKAPGKARADWQIFADLAARLDCPLTYGDAAEVRAEIAGLVPEMQGLDATNADRGGVSEAALTAWLAGPYREGMAHRYDLPAKLNAASAHTHSLYLGELLYHSGTLSTHNWGLMKIDAADQLLVNSREARKLKLKKGDRVRLSNDQGETTVVVTPDPGVMPGTLFFPKHCHDHGVRNLVKLAEGSREEGNVPQFRLTRVTLEKVG